MNRSETFLLPCLAALLLAGCGQTDMTPSQTNAALVHMAHFMEADADGNGVIDAAEIVASIEREFVRLDHNQDGVVTMADIHNPQQARPPGREHDNSRLSDHLPYDANGDGIITRAEHRECVLASVRAMDSSGDGRITFAEYRTARGF